MTPAINKLKPCPLCGSTDIVLNHYGTGYYVKCSDCRIFLGPLFNKREIVTMWNSRCNDTSH